jgi:dihydrofolate reductase
MIRLIAAIDRKRGLAKHGYEPWHIPKDGAYFNNQTKKYGGHVLVGGATFRNDLKGKSLPERTTYVFTHETEIPGSIILVHDISQWLKTMQTRDVWVAGGAHVFESFFALDAADELYLTHIDADFGCDQFFPDYKMGFSLVEQSEVHEQNGFRFYFAHYEVRK